MPAMSPRLDPRLRRAASRLDDAQEPIAETWRRVGLLADALHVPRPGYDTIRLIVRDHRRRRSEIRELLEPVVADFLQGRVSPWDVERVLEAARIARAEARSTL
jgi:hypothetical protein